MTDLRSWASVRWERSVGGECGVTQRSLEDCDSLGTGKTPARRGSGGAGLPGASVVWGCAVRELWWTREPGSTLEAFGSWSATVEVPLASSPAWVHRWHLSSQLRGTFVTHVCLVTVLCYFPPNGFPVSWPGVNDLSLEVKHVHACREDEMGT